MSYLPTKVSVIVPVYNNATCLDESLGSLFAQTLPGIEVIVVNDASTDESAEVLQRIAERESQLQVIHLPANVGVHEARAVGLRVARAPWVGFIDADDIARSEMYEHLYTACEKHSVDIAICGIDLVTSERRITSTKVRFNENVTLVEDIWSTFCALGFGTGSLCNKLYRKTLILEHGCCTFRWRQDRNEDVLVNVGCFMDAKSVRLIDTQLYEYVSNSDSATSKAPTGLAFTQLLQAYALAVDIFGGHGRAVLAEITKLYIEQMNYDCYYVDQVTDLDDYGAELGEAVSLLAEKYPIGLAALVNRGAIKALQSQKSVQSVSQALNSWCHSTGRFVKVCIKAIFHRATL